MSDCLDKLVRVSPRFARSVSLARDAHRKGALEGYILTATGRDVIRRLTESLRGDSPTRAWSLTGPYGSGKSAFALFAAQLLAGEQDVREQARDFLQAEDAELCNRLFGRGGALARNAGRLCPVLITGSCQPLEKSLAASLATALRGVARVGRPPQIVEQLERMASETACSGTAIVGLFEDANKYLEERLGGMAAGILLVIDELGKFLEYGASNPDQSDIFVLQEMSEAATRSTRPFLFLTILHQAVDRYAEHMSQGRRAEWSKIQGRFEDVTFEERTEQILRLMTHAIRHDGPEPELKALRKSAKAIAQETLSLDVRCGSMDAGELQTCLTACFPLHPLTALVLGPLFRQLAQNERSLFAFLGSSEPFGFQEFLRQTKLPGSFRLDHLFDYVMASLGPSLFAQHRGKVWAEVQSALERLHDASDTEIRLAKTIGLLQALANVAGMTASGTVLRTALKGAASEAETEQALDSLKRRSVTVFRKHTGGYALWEGSDVDIEERIQVGRQSVERDQNLAAFLTRQVPPQPMIARRHYFQTGTLRYFETCYSDHSAVQGNLFQNDLARDLGVADGRLVFCLPQDPDDRGAMRESVRSAKNGPIVVALPHDVYDLGELCHDLACLRWVELHTPELESDRTARREVQARLVIAEQNLQSHLNWLFSPANKGRCDWFYQGNKVPLSSQRELNDLLSKVCDEVYCATPIWRNELINRRELSSSAAAARRNLIEAMFEHAGEEWLGFTGNPPERSMYETLLKASRLHRKQGDIYAFVPPDNKAEDAVRQLWKAIDGFLAGTDNAKQSVENLFALLRQPPFGLKNGVLPVLLAAALVHGHSQVALYEEGSFVPRPNAAVFERMFRTPAKFELQRFRIVGPRAEVFQQYAAMLTRSDDAQPDLLTVVRPLVRMLKDLPDYVGKTRQLAETTQNVLRAMKEARQPDKLLFADLPAACGFPPFKARGIVDSRQIGA